MHQSTDSFSDSPYLEFAHIYGEERFIHIDSYCTYLQNLFTGPKTHKLDQGRWKIAKISTYEDTGSFRHKFLIAEARYGKHVVYMRLECKVSPKRKLFRPPQAYRPRVTPDSNALPSDSTGVPKNFSAAELWIGVSFFTQLPRSTGRAELVDVIDFEVNHHVVMPSLVVLARSASNFLLSNYLWVPNLFVHFTRGALKELYPKHVLLPTHGKGRRSIWDRLLLPNGAGSARAINTVVELFSKEWNTFNTAIHRAILLWAEEEMRKREEAERIKREEQSKREALFRIL